MYRDAALSRRCLFLSTGFYEWRHVPIISKKRQEFKATNKIMYRFHRKESEVFYSRYWNAWTDKDTGEVADTCAIVTTKANYVLQQIQISKKRMPTILTEELAAEWLSTGLSEERIKDLATFQIPVNQLHAYTVRKDFKTALDPTEPFIYDGLSEII